MIKLKLFGSFCHDCTDFKPCLAERERVYVYQDGKRVPTDRINTFIGCENEEQCKKMYKRFTGHSINREEDGLRNDFIP